MESEERWILPFRKDDPSRQEPKKLRKRKKKRRAVPEIERCIYFGEYALVFTRWQPEEWENLHRTPRFYADFGDEVISLALANWPGDARF